MKLDLRPLLAENIRVLPVDFCLPPPGDEAEDVAPYTAFIFRVNCRFAVTLPTRQAICVCHFLLRFPTLPPAPDAWTR